MSQTTSSDTYGPSSLVQQVHNIVHLNYRLQKQDSHWGVYQTLELNSYVESTIVIPAICLVIALLLLLIFTCVKCCCCRSTDSKVAGEDTHRTRYLVGFIFFILIAIISDQLIFYGDSIFTKGLHSISDNVNYLLSLFSQLSRYSNSLLDLGYEMKSELTSAVPTCPYAAVAAKYVATDYINYVEEFQSEVSSLSDNLSSADDKYHEYLVGYYQYFLFGLYGLIMFSCAWYALSACFTSKVLANGGTCFSQLFLVVLFVLCTILMIALMLSADFCMDPSDNVLQMLDYNSTTYQSTSYYLTCSGYNPLQYYISQANHYLDVLNKSVTTLLQTYCKNNSYLEQVLTNITKSKDLLGSMQGLLDCSTIRGYYDSIIETGYCRDIFQGTYLFWLAFYVAGAALCFVPWFLWGYRDSSLSEDLLPLPQHDTMDSGRQIPAGEKLMEMGDIYRSDNTSSGVAPIAVAITIPSRTTGTRTSPAAVGVPPHNYSMKHFIDEYNME